MKIVCDACQAKYSISDDKVQGKVFKIRCKKCSNIIVVRGGAGASEPAPAPAEKDTRVYDYGYDGAGGEAPADDAVWHLVINQDQVGPMSVAEVQQRFAAGEVDGETFTWREGFADWLPLSQVDAFTALVAAGATSAHAGSSGNGGGGAAAIGAMFGSSASTDEGGGTTRSDPGDLFASAGHSARDAAEDDGGDLFGSKPAAQSAQGSANSKLRGERNENSVLFSLNNLAQLASDKPAMSAPSTAPGGSGHATGAAGGEGSGLIDIRSMASAYMGGSGASMGKPAASSSIGSIDDLPVFGGGGFSEPAVIVPTARPAANNKLMFLMIGAVGLLAVVGIVLVVILMKGGKDKDKPALVADNGSAAVAKPDVAADTAKTPDPTTKPATDSAAAATGSAAAKAPDPTPTATDTAKAPDPAKTPDPSTKTTTAPKTTTTPKSPSTKVAATKTTTADPRPTPTKAADPKQDAGGGGCDEVSCVLNSYEGACCSKFKKGGAAKTAPKPSGGGGDLPDALDRGMISSGIANVKARVSGCGDKSQAKGKVKVHVKVGGDGRVANVSVESSPDPALGACVAAAVSKASFGKSQNGGSFSYPFVF